MNNHIFISIIMPAYNTEQYIGNAINSVLKQNYEDYELIVIDDGSTDGTLHRIQEATYNHPQCKVFHKANEGVSSARNIGLSHCKGQYIYFMDSDDALLPDALQTLAACVADRKCDALLVQGILQISNRTKKQKVPNVTNEDLSQYGPIACGWPTFVWNVLFSKKIIGNNKFNERIHIQEDTDFIFTTCKPGLTYGKCSKPIYAYNVDRQESALSRISKDDAINCKNIRYYIMVNSDITAPHCTLVREYGDACFGVLRRTASTPNVYRKEAHLTQKQKKYLKKRLTVKNAIVLLADRYKFLMNMFNLLNYFLS